MRERVDLSLFSERDERYQVLYLVDFGNTIVEIGHTDNVKGTMYRYVYTEDGCEAIWLSQSFDANPTTVDPRLPAELQSGIPEWEWAYCQLLDLANRAAVKITESRFVGLSLDVYKAYARQINIPSYKTYVLS